MRRIAVVGILALGLIALAPRAGAGGAVFDFERENYQPGDRVLGRVTFGRGAGGPIRADAGPFIAYLMKGTTYIDAPHIPTGAIPVGPMTLTRIDSGTWLARVDFTLPDIPPGRYGLGYCNDPCTNSSLGELVGGGFRVIPSGQDVTTFLLREHLQETRRKLQGRLEEARGRAREASVEARVLARQVGLLRHANRQLGEQIAALERASQGQPRTPAGFPSVLGWVLVGLTVLFGLIAFRPRRRLMLRPDPPAIERIDEADREPVR
jgi:hypothetical protein